MDDQIIKLLVDAVKGGYGLPFLAWFLWDKKRDYERRRETESKKLTGEYVSYGDIKAMKEEIKTLNGNMNGHFSKASEIEIKLAKLEVKMESVDEKIEKENAHIFGQLKSIHQTLSELMKHYGGGH